MGFEVFAARRDGLLSQEGSRTVNVLSKQSGVCHRAFALLQSQNAIARPRLAQSRMMGTGLCEPDALRSILQAVAQLQRTRPVECSTSQLQANSPSSESQDLSGNDAPVRSASLLSLSAALGELEELPSHGEAQKHGFWYRSFACAGVLGARSHVEREREILTLHGAQSLPTCSFLESFGRSGR